MAGFKADGDGEKFYPELYKDFKKDVKISSGI